MQWSASKSRTRALVFRVLAVNILIPSTFLCIYTIRLTADIFRKFLRRVLILRRALSSLRFAKQTYFALHYNALKYTEILQSLEKVARLFTYLKNKGKHELEQIVTKLVEFPPQLLAFVRRINCIYPYKFVAQMLLQCAN